MKRYLCLCCLIAAWQLCLHAAAPVKASSFGFSAEDATQCLQSAIDSGAPVVLVDNVGKDWIVKPIILRSNLELILDDNVTIRAKEGEYKGLNDSMFFACDKDNITVRGGKNSTCVMPKADYQDPARYRQGEWRHTFDIDGCYNFTIRDLTLDGSGGDGIAVGRGKTRVDSKNITVENVTMVNHHRLSLGVVAVNGMTVRNCRFLNTKGTPPNGGIDLEPNNPNESIANVLFEDCIFSGHPNGAAAELVLLAHKEGSPAVSCTFRRCVMENSNSAFILMDGGGRQADISLIDCSMSTPAHTGLLFSGLEAGNAHVKLSGCTLDCTSPNVQPFVFTSNRTLTKPFGDIDFGDLKVIMNARRQVFFPSRFPLGISSGMTGKPMLVCNGISEAIDLPALIKDNPPLPPEQRTFKALDFNTRDYTPVIGAKGVRTPHILLRSYGTFVQWTPANEPLELKFKLESATSASLVANVTVLDYNGGISDTFTFKGTEEYVYRLPPRATGAVWMFQFKAPGANTVAISSDAAAHGIVADKPVHFYITPVELYFIVPKDERIVKLSVRGEEPVSIALFNAKGDKVADSPNLTGNNIIAAKREPTLEDELWMVKSYDVVEDYYISIGSSCCPIFFTAPDNAVRRAGK